MTTFEQFRRKMETIDRRLLSPEAVERINRAVAKAAAEDADQAVVADLGDKSMSGWRRNAPIEVTTEAKPSGAGFVVRPVKRARGPMRVLEQGRNQGGSFGFAGPGVNATTGATARTKSGAVRKVRARRGKRWNGRTSGKGTWSDAVREIERATPERVRDYEQSVLRGVF